MVFTFPFSCCDRSSGFPTFFRDTSAVSNLCTHFPTRIKDKKKVSLYRDSALVLRTWKLGESDRIVSMLGENTGKIRAVVKGVRKTKSRFGSRLEPLSLVSVLCWRGRDLDVVSQAETVQLFREVRNNLERLSKANIILEVTEQVAQENHPDPDLFTLIVRVLRVLESENPPMLLSSFIWKLLANQGYRPQLDHCVTCGSMGTKSGFDPLLGGALCETHAYGRRVSPEVVSVISMSLAGQLARVLKIQDSAIVAETEALAIRSLEVMLERGLKTTRSSIIPH